MVKAAPSVELGEVACTNSMGCNKNHQDIDGMQDILEAHLCLQAGLVMLH